MTHLTTDQIIQFVSMDDMDPQSMALAATVNSHIRKCKKCLRLVRAFQMIHDEFSALTQDADFRNYLQQPDIREKLATDMINMDR